MRVNKSSHPLLRVCWLKDQRPGHLTKVRGVLRALACHRRVEIEEVEVRWYPGFLRQFASMLPESFLKRCLAREVVPPIDLIISAGGATEWPNALLARKLAIPNIYIGSLRTREAEDFTLLPRIDQEASTRVMKMEIMPSEYESGMVRDAANKELPELDGKYWTVLLGGNGSGCVWTEDDWHKQIQRIISEAEKAKVQLIVTSSRRTGPKVESQCKELFSRTDVQVFSCWYGDASRHRASVAAMLGKADRVIVTEDSVSMVSEAIASGKRVATISPEQPVDDEISKTLLHQYCENRRIVRLDGSVWDLAGLSDDLWCPISGEWHEPFGKKILEMISCKKD